MNFTATLKPYIEKAAELLQGEPARAIGYGAAIVIVGVVAVSNALGYTKFGENMDIATALTLATAAIATIASVIEGIRHYVYSPATVARIEADITPPVE